MRNLKVVWLVAVLVILLIAVPIVAVFAVWLPATAQYNKLFGAHVMMAMDQATFEGIEDQINVVWNQMNTTLTAATTAQSTAYQSPKLAQNAGTNKVAQARIE